MFMDQGGYAQLKAFAKERPPTEEEVGSRCLRKLLLYYIEFNWLKSDGDSMIITNFCTCALGVTSASEIGAWSVMQHEH
jgi:hypothetical protein